VAATVKVANNLGFKVYVAADATAAPGCQGYNGKFYKAEDIHQPSLRKLTKRWHLDAYKVQNSWIEDGEI